MAKPDPTRNYDQLAEAFAARVDTKAHNAHYERPATLSLLPQVAGQRVLDAGCGPSAYSQWLAEHGAPVGGIDSTPRLGAPAHPRPWGPAVNPLVVLSQAVTALGGVTFFR